MSNKTGGLQGAWAIGLGVGATAGAGTFPAKYTFSITGSPNCASAATPDFVVFNTGLTGSAAKVVAFYNLYTGCSTTAAATTIPTVYWSYNSGTGAVRTSVVLSSDGTKVAFIDSSSTAVLRILKWKPNQGSVASPATPQVTFTNTVAGSGGQTAWSSCPPNSSCMIRVAFQGSHANADTGSSPFYDYANDTIYVGDNSGFLHKFTGVFNGTPGEVTAIWPAVVNPVPI